MFRLLSMILAALAAIAFWFWPKANSKPEIFRVQELGLEEVIKWFKEQEQLLKANTNYTAILLKDGDRVREMIDKEYSIYLSPQQKMIFIQAIYDQQNSVMKKFRILHVNRITSDLTMQFGEKEMIVFR